jgi:hypothetical protein
MSDLLKQKMDVKTVAAVVGATALLSGQLYLIHGEIRAAVTVRQMSAWTEQLRVANPELKVPSIAETVLKVGRAEETALAGVERKEHGNGN